MKECLDEAMLQSYFDGELSTQLMEKATSHLASCLPCAAAARELEQECSLLDAAFAAEFEEVVPTEKLRRRVDAAVAGLHVVPHASVKSPTFFGALANLFSISPQRSLGYASLALILAFAGIFGVVKWRSQEAPVVQIAESAEPAQPNSSSTSVATATVPPVQIPVSSLDVSTPPRPQRVLRTPAPKVVPVRLIPGERSYLQTIAKLDTAINSQKKTMRPALQVEYERNLAVVDRAIAATRSAVKSNPNDPDAADFMFAAYQSKVDLLNTIADARAGLRSH